MKCPNLCRDIFGNVSTKSWWPFSHHLMGIGDSLGNAQEVLEALSATFIELRIHFGKCQKKQRSDGRISNWVSSQQENRRPPQLLPTVSPHISGFFCHFLEAWQFYKTYLKSEIQQKMLKTISSSSPIFFTLAKHTTTFGQN